MGTQVDWLLTSLSLFSCLHIGPGFQKELHGLQMASHRRDVKWSPAFARDCQRRLAICSLYFGKDENLEFDIFEGNYAMEHIIDTKSNDKSLKSCHRYV